MNNTKSSGNASNTYVVMPELFDVIFNGEELSRKTSSAFAYADKSKYKMLFSMRDTLNKIHGDCIRKCKTPDDYAGYVEIIGQILGELPDCVNTAFPGLVVLPCDLLTQPWNDDTLRRILSCGNSFTFEHSADVNTDIADMFLNAVSDSYAEINILYSGRVPICHTDTAIELWKNGCDITLCSKRFYKTIYNGNYSVCDGSFMIPGKTVIKKSMLDCSFVNFKGSDISQIYISLKSKIKELFLGEMALRFSLSARSTPYYRKDPYADSLSSLGLFYPCCLGCDDDLCVRGLLTGGASENIVSVFPVGLDSFDSEEKAAILRCITAACITVNTKYPVILRPTFRNKVHIKDKKDLAGILRAHAELSRIITGNSVLELTFSKDFVFPVSEELSSEINGFFGVGGTMIKFSLKEV